MTVILTPDHCMKQITMLNLTTDILQAVSFYTVTWNKRKISYIDDNTPNVKSIYFQGFPGVETAGRG